MSRNTETVSIEYTAQKTRRGWRGVYRVGSGRWHDDGNTPADLESAILGAQQEAIAEGSKFRGDYKVVIVQHPELLPEGRLS